MLSHYTADFIKHFPFQKDWKPWEVTSKIPDSIYAKIATLPEKEYTIIDGIAIHKTAVIEKGVTLKAPVIIAENCFIGAHTYLRGGVYLASSVKIGPGCEIKTSILLENTAAAHFNFIGESIVGSNVNFEAGSVIANHYNERDNKLIFVMHDGSIVATGVEKFGALVGDNTKVGANAVLSPGTLLVQHSVVKRLELVAQVP